MLVGHVAVGLAAKPATPRVSLGTLVLAALFSDLLWSIFLIAGIEHVQFTHGIGAANYLRASDIGLSHSLLGAGIWGSILASAYFAKSRYSTGAFMLVGLAISHWVLDWISHCPDLPLMPGGSQRLGLGLWNSIPATLIIEGGLWIAAIALYVGNSYPRTRSGIYGFWCGTVLLTLAWWNNLAGPPLSNPHVVGITSLLFFILVIVWAYWLNRVAQVG